MFILTPARSGALVLLVATLLTAGALRPAPAAEAGPALRFTMRDIDGKPVDLAKFQGKVVLMVNVASQCGLTPQYAKLQTLYEKYRDRGLVILGFPANEFGGQEPGSNAEIKEFCTSRYRVTFPMFSKIVVKGEGQDPLYGYLTRTTGKEIEWNFAKFLVNRKGELAGRFAPNVDPTAPQLLAAIEKELAAR